MINILGSSHHVVSVQHPGISELYHYLNINNRPVQNVAYLLYLDEVMIPFQTSSF